MSFFDELKRRSVFRVAIGYVGVSWLILQVIDVLFGIFEYDTDIDETILIVLAVGFIPAMILAWVFEWTPEGIRRDAEADRGAPAQQKLDRLLDRVVIGVLLVAVGFFAVDKFVLDPERDRQMVQEALIGSYGTKSIAVMPFLNMSSDPEQEYFSDGVTEELLNLLAQIPDLRVISRTSVFALKGLDLSVPEIGDRLDVKHVLEGSVRKAGDEIRITAQLIDAGTDTHLWSKTYDRELVDIFDIQDEIAGLVVDELKVELLGDMPKALRTDPVVLTLMMQARRAGQSGTSDQDERAEALLQEALRIDPNYVPALYAMGTWHFMRASDAWPFDVDAYEAAMALAERYHDRALAIDPEHAEVHMWRAWQAIETEHDFQKAADLYERALASAPGDAGVLGWSSEFARRIGKFDTSLALKRLAFERDPEPHRNRNFWQTYLDARRYDDAIESRLTFTGENVSYQSVVLAALLKGDAELALQYAGPDKVNPNTTHAFQAMALHSLGRIDEALSELEIQKREWAENDPVGTAMAALWLGDEEGALDLLYDRYWPHTYNFYREVFHPVWIPLHDNPRWLALCEESGWTKEALSSVEFDPVLLKAP